MRGGGVVRDGQLSDDNLPIGHTSGEDVMIEFSNMILRLAMNRSLCSLRTRTKLWTRITKSDMDIQDEYEKEQESQ
jgi:hypothetical protein